MVFNPHCYCIKPNHNSFELCPSSFWNAHNTLNQPHFMITAVKSGTCLEKATPTGYKISLPYSYCVWATIPISYRLWVRLENLRHSTFCILPKANKKQKYLKCLTVWVQVASRKSNTTQLNPRGSSTSLHLRNTLKKALLIMVLKYAELNSWRQSIMQIFINIYNQH